MLSVNSCVCKWLYSLFIHTLHIDLKKTILVLTTLSVPQFPSSVTPVCSPPSHLWTVSDSLWGVHLGRSVCPAEPWVRKVRAPHVTENKIQMNQNWEKELRKMFLCPVRDESVWLIFFLFFFASLFQTDVSIELYSDFQETSVWCCMRKAASCLPCVESRVKNTPWDSTSPSPMNAATHICATELQHPLPPTGLPHCSHYLFHTQFGE